MKKLDISKYKVFKQRDGSITYARWWKGNFLSGGGEYRNGGAGVTDHYIPDQWRALDPKKHHKIIGELKKMVKEGKIKVEPINGVKPEDWTRIDGVDNIKSLSLTRWACDGTWANIIPERYYGQVQELKKLFWIGLFCLMVITGSLA